MPHHSNRPTGVVKLDNEYVRSIPHEVFESTPKAVWAAIAISLATCGGDESQMATAAERVVREWHYLKANGVVPQDIPSSLRKYNRDVEDEDGA